MNTGWTGGPFGVGQRLKLEHTRVIQWELAFLMLLLPHLGCLTSNFPCPTQAIVDAIHSGELAGAEYEEVPIFNLQVCADFW